MSYCKHEVVCVGTDERGDFLYECRHCGRDEFGCILDERERLRAELGAVTADRDSWEAAAHDTYERERRWMSLAEAANADRERLREALSDAAQSLESAATYHKVSDSNVRAYCLSRCTVARAALAESKEKP